MNSINIDRGFITKLIETKDMEYINDKQIDSSFITSPEYKKIYNFITAYYQKNGSVPTYRIIKRSFPSVPIETVYKEDQEYVGTEEPLSYWCSELRHRLKHNTIANGVMKVASSLDEGNVESAYSQLQKTVYYIENNVEESTIIDTTKNPEKRLDRYLKRKETGGLIGLSTGIVLLDKLIKGLQNKQLITLIARPGVGKTWLQVIVGVACQLSGLTVLHLTTEMSEEQLQDRYDAVLMGKLYDGFNYGDFKSGALSPSQEKQYQDFLENKCTKLTPLYIDTATTVSAVSAKIDSLNPDLIMIDSAYLMQDELKADSDWLRVTHITRGLKQIAKNKNKPIFINSQATKETSKKTGPEMDNISFTSAVGQDSDVIMSLAQDEFMRADKEMAIKVIKQREGELGKVLINWDLDVMNFDSIFADHEKKSDDTEDTLESNTITI